MITSRYPQISCSLLRKTKIDLVAKQHITVVFNETDGDHKATTSRCFFLLLEIKAQKITLEVIQLSHSSQLELCTIFFNYADDDPVHGF